MVEQVASRIEVHDEEEPRGGFKGCVAPLQEGTRGDVGHHFKLVSQTPPVPRPRDACLQRDLKRRNKKKGK
jgi:hypothetical protein